MEQTNTSCHQKTQQNISSFPQAHLDYRRAGAVSCSTPGKAAGPCLPPGPPARCSDLWLPRSEDSQLYGTQLCWETLMGADSGASWGHGWQSQGKAPPPHSSHSQISALWHSAARLGPSLSSFQIKLQKNFSLFFPVERL